jgi:hypothetical protein
MKKTWVWPGLPSFSLDILSAFSFNAFKASLDWIDFKWRQELAEKKGEKSKTCKIFLAFRKRESI